MFVVDSFDEKCKERVDGALTFGEIHAGRGESINSCEYPLKCLVLVRGVVFT